MTFAETLNGFLARTGRTGKQLSAAAGLGESTVSRYRTGQRVPGRDSAVLQQLAEALAAPAGGEPSAAVLLAALRDAAGKGPSVPYPVYLRNLRRLVKTTGLCRAELARQLHYDASYISRILSGQRRPANLWHFTDVVAAYAARRCEEATVRRAAAALIGRPDLTPQTMQNLFLLWLNTNRT
ncbi:MAG: hypothetical protein IKI50_00745 [Clostridia bacterium]|nr:hypothetical protein [Clostridia bacterium]